MLPESNQELCELFRQVSPLTSELIDECNRRKIKILSHEEVGLNSDKECCMGYGPTFSDERAIICSKKVFELHYQWGFTAPQVEFTLAHEMGHAVIKDEKPPCSFTPLKRFNRLCCYEELRADYEGLKVLDKLCGGIKNWVYRDSRERSIQQMLEKESLQQVESFLQFRSKRPKYCRNCSYQEKIGRLREQTRKFIK